MCIRDSSNSAGRLGYDHNTNAMTFYANAAERMRITSDGRMRLGAGAVGASETHFPLFIDNNEVRAFSATADMADTGSSPFVLSRLAYDGDIIQFKSPSGDTGTISVSGSTVSYNAFTGSHYCEPPVDAVPAYGEIVSFTGTNTHTNDCLLYTSPRPRAAPLYRMQSAA